MRTLTLHFLLFLALSLFSSACAPQWTVIRQASPDPFAGHPQFTVQSLDFDRTQVGGKSEAEYAAGKEPDKRASWQADKEGMNEQFSAALASFGEGLQVTGPGGPGAVIRPTVSFIEPGYYAYVSSRPTEVRMSVQILDPQGQVLDEILIHSSISATMTDPAQGTRLRQASAELGKITARYLRTRFAPGK